MVVKTGESALNVGGVIESYLPTPVIKLATDGTLSLPEIGRIVPALAGYQLHPVLVVSANGTFDRLVMDLDLTTEAGLVRGQLMTDLRSPDFAFAGPLHVERLNLAPILKNPAQRSDITGDVRIDLTLPSNPASDAGVPSARGHVHLQRPTRARARVRGHPRAARRLVQGTTNHARGLRARAYGASATARGLIVLPEGRRPVSYDLQGTAADVDLRRLPASTRAPKLDTVLSLSDYHVTGKRHEP